MAVPVSGPKSANGSAGPARVWTTSAAVSGWATALPAIPPRTTTPSDRPTAPGVRISARYGANSWPVGAHDPENPAMKNAAYAVTRDTPWRNVDAHRIAAAMTRPPSSQIGVRLVPNTVSDRMPPVTTPQSAPR